MNIQRVRERTTSRAVGLAWLMAASLHIGAFSPSPSLAQLNENCTVSILNRTAQVQPDGSWRIDNVPADIGAVRARTTGAEIASNVDQKFAVWNIETSDLIDERKRAANELINFLDAHDWKREEVSRYPEFAEAIQTLGLLRVEEAAESLIPYLDFPDPDRVIGKGVIRATLSLDKVFPAINALVSIGSQSFDAIIDAAARGRIEEGEIAWTSAIFVLLLLENAHPHSQALLLDRLNYLKQTEPYPSRRDVYESIIQYLE